jgi:hypothetical protein
VDISSRIIIRDDMDKHPSTTQPDEQQPRWNIYVATSTPAKLLGSVEAIDADAAIAKAIEEFDVEPTRQNRLIAVRRP